VSLPSLRRTPAQRQGEKSWAVSLLVLVLSLGLLWAPEAAGAVAGAGEGAGAGAGGGAGAVAGAVAEAGARAGAGAVVEGEREREGGREGGGRGAGRGAGSDPKLIGSVAKLESELGHALDALQQLATQLPGKSQLSNQPPGGE